MPFRGLFDLIVTMMAAGGVRALPAHDQQLLHRELAALAGDDTPAAERLWTRVGGRPKVLSSERKVRGLPATLWSAVNSGAMTATEYADGSGAYVLTHAQQVAGRRLLLSLPADEAELVYRTGAAWAASSTTRKNRASAAESPRATRRSSRA